jgi:hypothetical protein
VGFAFWLSGCGQDAILRCEDRARYVGSPQIPPIQIPDDLDPPEESEALSVPGSAAGEAVEVPGRPCLEAPPEYFDEGLPG